MRALFVIFALLLSFGVERPVGTAHADRSVASAPFTKLDDRKKPVKSREATKLFEEYAAEETSEDRKAEIFARLKTASTKTLSTAASRSLRSTETRDAAFELINTLPIPGMFKTLKKYVDGKTERGAVRAICANPDKGAHKFLLARWKDSDLEGESFEIVDAAFRESYLTPKTVAELRKLQKNSKVDETRRAKIPAILQFQMDLTDEEAKALDEKWDEYFTRYAAMNQTFPVKGEDLLATADWSFGFSESEDEAALVKKYRGKYLIEKLGVFQLRKITWKSGTVRIRLMVLEGHGTTAGVMMKNNAMVGPSFRDEQWLLTESIRQSTVAGAPLQWMELTFTLSGSSLTCKMNGQQLGATTDYGNQINGLFFTTGQSRCLIGSVERIR